jgi:ubiquinone/menaquinone biosynthesis C-methylase UbiE
VLQHSLPPILRYLFLQLYHGFAWSYDLVAAAVSLGRWRYWIHTSLPFIRGSRVLELAFGTGMLQQSLLADRARMVAGLDESAQMAALTRRRLANAGVHAPNLIRARAQRLPYANDVFDSAVSTFPTEFIVDPETLAEVGRVLRPGGRLIVVPAAWIVGRRLIDRAAAWLFKATHQSPEFDPDEVARRFSAPLEQAGFHAAFHQIEVDASVVLVMIGSK